MMARLYKNSLHRLLKQKYRVAAAFLIPVLTGAVLFFAFSEKGGPGEYNEPIAVAVVVEQEEDRLFLMALNEAGTEKKAPLFKAAEYREEEAGRLLQEGKITGYVTDGGTRLFIRNSGSREIVLKLFMDQYRQWRDTYSRLEKQKPGIMAGSWGKSYVKEETDWKTDDSILPFYALFSLACLFGLVWGDSAAAVLDAGHSAKGALLAVSGIPKWKLSASQLLSAVTIHTGGLFLLYFYFRWILRIELSPCAALLFLPASIFSVGLGALASSFLPGGKKFRLLFFLSAGVICAVPAGLLSPRIKFIAESGFPAASWVNPAALITDALYGLYQNGPSGSFYFRTAIFCSLAVLISALCMIRFRREQYADI